MTKRRSRGEGSIYWSEKRQRWVAEITIGFRPNGKRIYRRASAKTKTEAKTELKKLLKAHEVGNPRSTKDGYTVANAVNDWLANYELTGRDPSTVNTVRSLADNHIIPMIGARKLRELSAEDVDDWLAGEAIALVTSTLRTLRSILRRAIKRAQGRDRVDRNVVLLTDCPVGQGEGRPSKALTMSQAEAVLAAAETSRMRGYVVVALLTGARTEELRALRWDHVDLKGAPKSDPPVLPNVKVWRSVRAKGETKTRKSRRSLALPQRAVEALKAHQAMHGAQRVKAGPRWREHGLVFPTNVGTEQNANNVIRDFRKVVDDAGLVGVEWTPREMRHSFVSLLSDSGMPIEQISRLVGHSSTAVTELVYRKQIRPVIEDGAVTMDRLFPDERREGEAGAA